MIYGSCTRWATCKELRISRKKPLCPLGELHLSFIGSTVTVYGIQKREAPLGRILVGNINFRCLIRILIKGGFIKEFFSYRRKKYSFQSDNEVYWNNKCQQHTKSSNLRHLFESRNAWTSLILVVSRYVE